LKNPYDARKMFKPQQQRTTCQELTRNSSADVIANVNFVNTHYKIQYTRAYIPPQIDAVMCWNAGLPNSVK